MTGPKAYTTPTGMRVIERREKFRTARSNALWRIRFTIAHTPGGALEVWTALYAFFWGLFVVLPFDTFPRNPAFAPMLWAAKHMLWNVPAEPAWGGALLLTGVVQLGGVVMERYAWRTWGALATAGMWVFISVCYILADPLVTSTVSGPMNAVGAYVAYFLVRTRQQGVRRLTTSGGGTCR